MFGTAPVLGNTTVDRDREFDQTAKTVTEPARHVSPAIHEHRINVLEQEKRDLSAALESETVAHGKTQHNLNLAEIRIKQFEDFTRTLAAKCDQMIERCEDLGVNILDLPPAIETVTATDRAQIETPPAVETHADGVRETSLAEYISKSEHIKCGFPGAFGRCALPLNHLGPCMTGAAA